MAGETLISYVGNLVDDPELKFLPTGVAVCQFRMASTPRTFNRDTSAWVDGEPLFLTVKVWRQQAEQVAESLMKGMRVVVLGALKQRSYDTKEGEKRTVYEVEGEEVAPSLKFATAKVSKAQRQQGQGGGQQQSGQRQQQSQAQDPWASSAPQQQAQQGGGGWGAPAAQGFAEEPPF